MLAVVGAGTASHIRHVDVEAAASFAGVMVCMPGVRVLFPLPPPRLASWTSAGLFLLPYGRHITVLWQPVGFAWFYDPSTEDREGDSSFCCVIDS